MVAIASTRVEAYIKRPDAAASAFLVYGPDAGLVGERAIAIARAVASREKPEGEILRLDDNDIEADPDRLSVELLTMPMFGGRKIVRIGTSRRVNVQFLKPIIERAPLAGTLIVEADTLRKEDALRLLFERSPHAAAIACYADEAVDIQSLAREILGRDGLSIGHEAMTALVSSLGADRALSRMEIEKLALYAAGTGEVQAADVEAIVGDATGIATDQIIDAAATGDAKSAVVGAQRMADAGESLQGFLVMLQWHLARLHRARAGLDAGRSLDEVQRQMRPPLFGRRRAAFDAQVRRWQLPQLEKALERVRRGSFAARADSGMEIMHVERLLMEIARLASATRSRKP